MARRQAPATPQSGGVPVGHQTLYSTLRGPIFGAGAQYALSDHWSLTGKFLYTNTKASGTAGGGLEVKATLVGAKYRF